MNDTNSTESPNKDYFPTLENGKPAHQSNRRKWMTTLWFVIIPVALILGALLAWNIVRYEQADRMLKQGAYPYAVEGFRELGIFWDSKSRYKEAKQEMLEQIFLLQNEGKETQALEWYSYLCATEGMPEDEALLDIQKSILAKAEEGDLVIWGREVSYKLDAEDEATPLSWIVLEKQEGQMLLLSKNVLSVQVVQSPDDLLDGAFPPLEDSVLYDFMNG